MTEQKKKGITPLEKTCNTIYCKSKTTFTHYFHIAENAACLIIGGILQLQTVLFVLC